MQILGMGALRPQGKGWNQLGFRLLLLFKDLQVEGYHSPETNTLEQNAGLGAASGQAPHAEEIPRHPLTRHVLVSVATHQAKNEKTRCDRRPLKRSPVGRSKISTLVKKHITIWK